MNALYIFELYRRHPELKDSLDALLDRGWVKEIPDSDLLFNAFDWEYSVQGEEYWKTIFVDLLIKEK